MNAKTTIYAFHLLNDYSGSPKVLMQLCKDWIAAGHSVHLVTCSGRTGFLSDIPGVQYHYFWYRFAGNPLLRLFNLVLSQCLLVIKMWQYVTARDIIYVNTVLPFGAAFLARIKGCRLIYHIHETSVKPAIFKRFLFGIVDWCADDVTYVSHYLASEAPFPGKKQLVLHNVLESDFLTAAAMWQRPVRLPARVLMVCSMKTYKGIHEFVELARLCPQWSFRLVLNASAAEIQQWTADQQIPPGLEIFPTQTDLHPCYQWADVVLNLSRPDGWVETFGLTILEGMAYGLPAIVPPVGGITELVEDGQNGYRVDSRDMALLQTRLTEILSDQGLYLRLRAGALARVSEFSEAIFRQKHLARF